MTSSELDRTLVGVIADDLTGANATGILLTRRGFKTASFTGLAWPARDMSAYACVSFNTESRTLPPNVAHDNVTTAARLIIKHGGHPLAKRIDSTLRGNLGPELEAVLSVLGPTAMAVVCPAFPASGRATRAARQYVNGVPLAETAVRNDPFCPVTESHIPTLLKSQTKLTVDTLGLETVREGAVPVAKALKAAAAKGVRLLVVDAETDDDIEALGEGMALSTLTLIAADPGPLTAAYVSAVRPSLRRRILVIAGSTALLSREQTDKLESDLDAHLITVDAGKLAEGAEVGRSEVERIAGSLAELPVAQYIIGVRTSEQLPVDHAAAEYIARGFAEIAARTLDLVPDIGGIYAAGGEIALAICNRLGANALEVTDEVLPMAVCGRLLGGSRPGLAIVSKGAMVGGPDAATTCVRHLMKETTRHA